MAAKEREIPAERNWRKPEPLETPGAEDSERKEMEDVAKERERGSEEEYR
jgi:hypothetical protein